MKDQRVFSTKSNIESVGVQRALKAKDIVLILM
jgi:hypothetical protein